MFPWDYEKASESEKRLLVMIIAIKYYRYVTQNIDRSDSIHYDRKAFFRSSKQFAIRPFLYSRQQKNKSKDITNYFITSYEK